MRVIWKDTIGNTCPPMTYKNVTITRYDDGTVKGWTVDMEGDNNIYLSQDCARNAINKALGGKPRKNASRLHLAGIKIVGTTE